MAKIPIKSMDYPTEMSMTYGGTGTLLVNVKKEPGASAVSFQWYKVEDGKATAVGSATTKNQFDLSALKLSAGNHTFRFSATCDGYEKMSKDIVVTVQRASISASLITPPIAQENLTYTGQEQALITAGSVTKYGTMQYSLTENGTYSQVIPTGTDAGTYTVWYRVIGDANHNDIAPASVLVRIGKKSLTITGVTAASKPYDGTTNAGITSVTFDGVNLNRGTDYTVTASFDDAGAGNGKNITATVTLMEQTAKNYALEQSSFPTTGSIIKAAFILPSFSLTVSLAACITVPAVSLTLFHVSAALSLIADNFPPVASSMALNAFAAAVFAASAFSLTVFFTVSQALEAVSLIVLHAVPSASFIPPAILDTVSLAAVSLSEINPFAIYLPAL